MLETLKPIGTIARMWADTTSTRFSDSFLQMFYFTHLKVCKGGEFIHFDKGCASWHILGRNTLAQNFLGDWLFQSDTDHQFAPDMLYRLLKLREKYGAKVISAAYQYKNPPHSPVMGVWDENDKLNPIFAFPRGEGFDAYTVGAVGGGGLLIDREVFQKIAETGEQPFDCIGGLSEDYSFCLRCKRLGIPVYVAPQVETHHLVLSALSLDDYRPNNEEFKLIRSQDGVSIGDKVE